MKQSKIAKLNVDRKSHEASRAISRIYLAVAQSYALGLDQDLSFDLAW